MTSSQKKFKTIDLFAGIGGVRLGFESAGFETAFANDFDKNAKITYDQNFDLPKLEVQDIRLVKTNDLPEFDILLGGFPCQPFSIAGYRKGLQDEGRGDLFFEILRILKDRKPQSFMLENVKNLYSHDSGETYRYMKSKLLELGYFVKEAVLNSMEYGNTPQNRERLYIVGTINKDVFDSFRFPQKIALTTQLKDILEPYVPEKYYYNNKLLFEKLKDTVVNKGSVYQWRRIYVRENKKGVSPTLTANMGTGGHNVPIIIDDKGIRKLTPLECLRLQSYPKSYKLPTNLSDTTLYKQIGNSVTVSVIERIAINLKLAMSYSYSEKYVFRNAER